jgi:hypothetical protein
MPIRTQLNIFVVFLFTLLVLSAVRAGSEESTTIPAGAGQQLDLAAYHGTVADYFEVEPATVERLAGELEPVDLPVALFLARHGVTTPMEVAASRTAGASWQQVADDLEVGPESFYFPLDEAPIAPFTNVYALYHDRTRAEWGEIRLSDDDLRLLVHLRFASDVTGRQPSEIARLHARGLQLVSLHQTLAPRPVEVAAARGGERPTDDRG